MISLQQLLDHAAEHRYGVPAFSVNNLEQIQPNRAVFLNYLGSVRGAVETES
jgi:fructose/tagatose bisphosphate aldolase